MLTFEPWARALRGMICACALWMWSACGSEPTGESERSPVNDADDAADSDDSEESDAQEEAPPPGAPDRGGPRRDDAGGARDGAAAARDGASPEAGQKSDAAVRDAGDAAARDDGGSGGDGGACKAKLLPLPEDPKQRGPWEVGVRTAKIGRLTVEVFYPAKPGSTAGVPEATYDIRVFLPERERSKVPDAHSPAVTPIGGHLYRDVPIDDAHGPYPVVIFIHGTASFRIASGTTNTHWASRGFVVLAADYPGLGLSDQVSATLECGLPQSGGQDLPGDVDAQLAALKAPSGDTEFLKGRVDLTRLGISGHSQGGCVSATLSSIPNVRIVMPFSGSTPTALSDSLESILYVSGMDDTVIGYSFPLIGNVVCPLGSSTTDGAYTFSPGPPDVKKRIVGIKGGGHLVVTDLCQKNDQGRNAVQEAQFSGVCGIHSAVIIGLPALFDCGSIDWKVGVEAVNYATTAALEETLHCRDRTQQFAGMKAAVPAIEDFRESVAAP